MRRLIMIKDEDLNEKDLRDLDDICDECKEKDERFSKFDFDRF